MSTPANVDRPPLNPEWLLNPLPPRDATAPDLDPTDSRFTAMLDLVTKGDYITAGQRAEQAMQDGLHDLRVLGYYLFGYFAQRGPQALPVVYRILQQMLGPSSDAIGPREKREIHAENTLQWLFSAMLRNVEHHAKSKDARWQEWLDGKNRPAIDEALTLSTAMEPLIAQHSAKSRAALRFSSLDGWLRGLEPASSAPDARSKETQENGRSNSVSIVAPVDAAAAEAGSAAGKASRDAADEEEEEEDNSPAARRRRLKRQRAEERKRAQDAKRYSLSLDLGDGNGGFSRAAAAPSRSDDDDEFADLDADEDSAPRRDADADDAPRDDEFSSIDEADVEHEDEDPRAQAQRGARGFLEDDRETSEASLRAPRGRLTHHAGSPTQIGGETVDTAPEWGELVGRLQAFEQLLQSGEYMKAAVLASDIQTAITTFDPVRYFPSLFAGYLAAFSTHMRPLETCLKESGSVQFKVLQKLYQVNPEEFLRKR